MKHFPWKFANCFDDFLCSRANLPNDNQFILKEIKPLFNSTSDLLEK